MNNVYDTTPVTIDTTKFKQYNIYKSYAIQFAVLKENDKYKNTMSAHKIIHYSKQTGILTLGPKFGDFYWSDTEAYIIKNDGLHTLQGLVKIKKWTSRLNWLSYLQTIKDKDEELQVCNNDNIQQILQNNDLQRFISEYM